MMLFPVVKPATVTAAHYNNCPKVKYEQKSYQLHSIQKSEGKKCQKKQCSSQNNNKKTKIKK